MNKKKPILLVGANGIIGSEIYKKIIKKFSLIPLTRSQCSIPNSFNLDLTKKDDIKKIVDKIPLCEALIFLVGLAHKKGKKNDFIEFRESNRDTLINLISCLNHQKKLPKKIIFTSTISVYGENLHQKFYFENSITSPFSPYAITKLEAENFLLNILPKQSWVLRLAPVYSKKFKLNIIRRVKIVNLFFRVGSGESKLSLCNIKNIISVIEKIIDGDVPNDVYNISDDKEYTYNDLLRYMNAKFVFPVPLFIVRIFFYLGVFIKNIFLKENMTKLSSDNIFSSKKIKEYVPMNHFLRDI